MAVAYTEDPSTGEKIAVITGVVDKVTYRENPNGVGTYGDTHSASLKIGDDWVNQIKLKVKEGNSPELRVNNGSNAKPDWQTVEQGDTVRIVAKPNEYNGKTYLNTGSSKIKITKKGDGANRATTQGVQTNSGQRAVKRDNTPVLVGHALKGGGLLIARGLYGNADIVKASARFHDITDEVRQWYDAFNKAEGLGLDEYSVGVGAGNAVNTVAQYADLNAIKDHAIALLSDDLGLVQDHVKGVPSASVAGAAKQNAVVTKASPATAASRRRAAPVTTPPADSPLFDDDDTIPF